MILSLQHTSKIIMRLFDVKADTFVWSRKPTAHNSQSFVLIFWFVCKAQQTMISAGLWDVIQSSLD